MVGSNHDRWFFIQLYRWFPSILKVVTIVQPETLVSWQPGRLSQLLALEIELAGRAPANPDGIARADPADEHGSLGLASLNQPSPRTW
jgi:hypothetical protein